MDWSELVEPLFSRAEWHARLARTVPARGAVARVVRVTTRLPVRHCSCSIAQPTMTRAFATVLLILLAAGCASGPRLPRPPVTTPSAMQSRIVALAMTYVGTPYARGGATPTGFDCSGLVMYVYGRAGIPLPHSAEQQYRLGSAVDREELEPGDIVFFDRLGHSGIYVGDLRFVHATKPGDVVKISRLDEDWYRRRWVGARRLL